ncbi:ABC transporter substrate-binding protein [Thermodesulfobacteriota bacterium]
MKKSKGSLSEARGMRFLLAAVAALFIFSLTFATVASAQKTFTFVTKLTDSKFDPALHFAEMDAMDIINLYDALVYPAAGDLPQPHLATSWEASQGGKVWTFKLRKGVKFHDGRPFTAKDVVYSIDRMLTMKKGYSYLWLGLLEKGSTKAVDDYTVKFTLKKPFGPFVETLVQFFIVNSELIKEKAKSGKYGNNGDYGMAYLQNHDAGSGPYMLEKVVPDARRIFVQNKKYWKGWGKRQYDRVVIEIIRETATVRSLLESGKVELVDQWQPVEFYKNVKKNPNVVVPEDVDNKLYIIQINNQKPPFDDINFRKAVLHGFDYGTAIKAIFGGGEKAHGPIPSQMPGYDPTTPTYEFNLEKARSYLKKSRYKTGQFTLNCDFIKAGVHEQVTLLLQANMATLGIKVKLNSEAWPTLAGNASKAKTSPHFFPVYNTAKYPSADAFTFNMYHPASAGGWQAASWYRNKDVTKMVEQARVTMEGKKRNTLYVEAAKQIVKDAASLWVVYPIHRVALNK